MKTIDASKLFYYHYEVEDYGDYVLIVICHYERCEHCGARHLVRDSVHPLSKRKYLENIDKSFRELARL